MSDIRELKERACHYNEWGPFDEAFEILLAENVKLLAVYEAAMDMVENWEVSPKMSNAIAAVQTDSGQSTL